MPLTPNLPPISQGDSETLRKLPFKPRRMTPVHIEGITEKSEAWTLDLIAIPMTSIRRMFGFEEIKSVQNLETWAQSLGEALYNPLWLRIQTLDQFRQVDELIEVMHPYIELISGHRRIRVLEAYDFNFVYAYLWIGPWGEGFLDSSRKFTDVNNRVPALSSRNHEKELVYPEPI